MRKHRAESIGTLKGPSLFVNGTRVAGTQPKNMGNVFHIFEIDEGLLNVATGRELISGGYAVRMWIDGTLVWVTETGGYSDRLGRHIWPARWEAQRMAETWENNNPKIIAVKFYRRRRA